MKKIISLWFIGEYIVTKFFYSSFSKKKKNTSFIILIFFFNTNRKGKINFFLKFDVNTGILILIFLSF